MTERRMKAAANQAVSYRNYRRARDRALTKLATAHFEEYKGLLEREKAIDEELGKKWLDINGTTTNQLGVQPTTPVKPSEFSPDNNRTNESYYGGEE